MFLCLSMFTFFSKITTTQIHNNLFNDILYKFFRVSLNAPTCTGDKRFKNPRIISNYQDPRLISLIAISDCIFMSNSQKLFFISNVLLHIFLQYASLWITSARFGK